MKCNDDESFYFIFLKEIDIYLTSHSHVKNYFKRDIDHQTNTKRLALCRVQKLSQFNFYEFEKIKSKV
jgi:hypothetical protein